MSALLLDVNVLMALTWPSHPQFEVAETWFLKHAKRWATCPLTELGFIRLSSNRKIVPSAGDAALAIEAMARTRKLRGHEFWPAALALSAIEEMAGIQGHGQVTDAYLLSLAIHRGGRMATFDGGVQALARDVFKQPDRVVLIPTE